MRFNVKSLVPALVCAALLLGCEQVQSALKLGSDPAKCQQALQVTRQALGNEDFTGAQTWREYAWKQCEDRAALEALDKELTQKRADVETRKREAEARTQAKRDLLKVFLSWVRDNRADPSKASAQPNCDPPAANDPKGDKSEERFCSASRTAGTTALGVRYYQAQPAAARFNMKLPEATTCEEIGAPKLVKSWQVAATGGRTAQRFRCEFTSGPLAGLHAVGSAAINADLYVFDPVYLERDPGMRAILEGG
jgi:hypothetical protein